MTDELKIMKMRWVTAIKKVDYIKASFDLESPKFWYGNWRIGTEHQRQFRSIVFNWTGPSEEEPKLPSEWFSSKNDKEKHNFPYRYKLFPEELESFLAELDGRTRGSGQFASQSKVIKIGEDEYDQQLKIALSQIAKPGEQVLISAVEDQMEKNMHREGVTPLSGWRKT